MLPSVSYVVPLRWFDDGELADLLAYLRPLAEHAELIVVDGSEEPLFSRHADALRGIARHVPLRAPTLMGKVGGVDTGVRLASHERVVIADDDVRYTPDGLARAAALLDATELVRPQNVFSPMPWHARWDTARSLLNRAFWGDYPGTLALRRSFFLAMGSYRGDVMFENLELIRTVRAAGGRVVTALDLYVARRPPTAGRFGSQRVRQAYDDLAMPARLALFLAIAPALALRPRVVAPRSPPAASPSRRSGDGGRAAASCSRPPPRCGRRRGSRSAPSARGSQSGAACAAACVTATCAFRTPRAPRRRCAPGSGRRRGRRSTRLPVRRASSASLGAANPVTAWVPSQNGRVLERPHRQSAIVPRWVAMTLPSWSRRSNYPRTT